MQKKRKDLAEKIIEAEIQKTGAMLESAPSMGQMEEPADVQSLLEKRSAYRNAVNEQVAAYRREESAKKARRQSTMVKAAMLVLVVSGCLFAFSMRSEATRMWWLSSVERIVGFDRGNVVDNSDERIYSDMTEKEACAEMQEKIGAPVPELKYKPEGMEFDGVECDETILNGKVQYLYNGSIVHLHIFSEGGNSSYDWKFEGNYEKVDTVDTDYGQVLILREKNTSVAEPNFLAEWIYENHQYELIGNFTVDEMTLILENIFY